jgi:hypothetical protein
MTQYQTTNNRVPPSVIDLSEGDLILYPNPSGGSVNIRASNGESIGEIRVYSITGRLVHLEQYPDPVTERSLDLNRLARGIYLVRTATQKSVVTSRLVIE